MKKECLGDLDVDGHLGVAAAMAPNAACRPLVLEGRRATVHRLVCASYTDRRSVSKEKKASDSRLNLSCDGEGEGDGVERYALDDVDLGRHLPLLFCGGLELGGWDWDSGSVVRVGFGEEEGYGEG